ncbi:B3/4 domain-containing protein [Antarctobacter sp.]|uniref:B3/B4 domain-containing protein n=1 Tax=Antarctobacter sp. TaxID=1872577 RepID=UPI003A8E0493
MHVIPHITSDIWVQRPDFHLLSITLRHAQVQTETSTALSELLAEAEASARQDDALRDAHLAAWGEAYRGFGAKPNRTPCSAAALLKRTRKDGTLPRISPLVDAYNAVSVLYGVPVGGEDLDRYAGRPRLIVAKGDEPFDTNQNGAPVVDHPDPGEIAWCDERGVTCRRWNWRQGHRTMITAESRALWLVLEALAPMTPTRLQEAGSRLEDVISSLCPTVEIATSHLDQMTANLSA